MSGRPGEASEIEMIFLGTGGARFCMTTQKRQTGGIRILRPINMQIDPGPGSIVYSNKLKLDPSKIRALLVSHGHPDHYADAEIFLEAMTQGGLRKRGFLLGSRSVISGNERFDRAISKYHLSLPNRVVEMKPGDKEDLGSVSVTATSAKHSDPDTIGFRLRFAAGDIGYISDTEYFPELSKQFKGVRILVMSVLRPRGTPWKGHLSTEDAANIGAEIRPEMSILTHFGMRMIFAGPSREARAIQEATGVRTIAARDNMRVHVGKQISIGQRDAGPFHFPQRSANRKP